MCFIAVPWMLLPKPLILKKRHEARSQRSASYGLLQPDDNAYRFQRFTGGWAACGGVIPEGGSGLLRSPGQGLRRDGGGLRPGWDEP